MRSRISLIGVVQIYGSTLLLTHAGKISKEVAQQKANLEYENYKEQYINYQTPVERHFQEAIKDVKQIVKQRKK